MGSLSVNRRQFLALSASGVAAAGLPRPVAAASAEKVEPIRGRVTCGIAAACRGVIVSDGLNCVRTSDDGSFELPGRVGARFLSVTTPSGYTTTWPHLALPRKWQKYEFPLSRDPLSAGKGCSFVHIADSEISSPGPLVQAWMDRVRRIADQSKAAFIVHTGDICRRPGLVTHQRMMNDYTMGRRMVYCIGNHDLEVGPTGESMFEALYGPVWYSFEAGGIHFCVTPMPGGDYRPSYTMDEVADWLRNDLALVPKSMPVVLFNHMVSNWGGPKDDVGFVIGRERPINLRKACNFTGFVYGHVHNNRFRRIGRCAQVSTANPNMGGIDHAPESIRVVRVAADGTVTSELHYGHYDSLRKPSASVAWEADAGAPVLYGEPIVVGSRLLVGVSDEDGLGTGAVVAYETSSGREVWRARVPGSIRNRMVVIGKNIVAQDGDGRVYAFALADGSPVWQTDVGLHPWLILSSGLAADSESGLVFAGDGRRLTAFEAKSGRKVWSGSGWKSDAGDPCADAPCVGEGVLVFGANWNGFHANDAATGRHLWFHGGGEIRFTGATPLVTGGKAYVLGSKSLFELDLRTGKTLRQLELGTKVDVPTRIVAAGSKLIFGTASRGLVAVDRQAFKIAWCGEVGDSLVATAGYACRAEKCVATAPVALNDARWVAAACADGTVRIWSVADGRTVRVFDTAFPYTAGCAADGKRLFAADLAGRVRAFDFQGEGTV